MIRESVFSLFTQGGLSVRVTRIVTDDDRIYLKVEGPRSERACYAAGDEDELRAIRDQLEEAIEAQGFTRSAPLSDRRAGQRRSGSRTSERRQPWENHPSRRPCPPALHDEVEGEI